MLGTICLNVLQTWHSVATNGYALALPRRLVYRITGMMDVPSQSAPHWYEAIERVLRGRIAGGALPAGARLAAAPLAELFQVSRVPVHRALKRLEADGLVRRNGRRGYVVEATAPAGLAALPDAGAVGPDEMGDLDDVLGDRSAWRRIYGVVETEIASNSMFGEFHVVEAELAKHFHVSRTVARDVLGRLHERGLIRKNQSSHWIAGPLSAQAVRERHDLRRLLEPPALLAAAAGCDHAALQGFHQRLKAAEESASLPSEAVDALEDEFQDHLVLSTPNTLLAEAIRHNRLPLVASRRSLRRLGLPADATVVTEHRLTVELLLRAAAAAAVAAFDAHLAGAMRRSVALLKTVAIIPDPTELPPYLVRRRP
jgi:DNA-binding GntR family transcriptional regulator